MKRIILFVVFLASTMSYSQVNGSFSVGGDIDKFYPVLFFDGGWSSNVATKVTLGRSATHTDSSWRGALIADFKYHITNYGNGANFIDANITSSTSFIAGWRDATNSGSCWCIIIWLKGGGTTYYYQSNYAINPTIHDGIQNSLPYNEQNGPSHTYKTSIDEYAITSGSFQNTNASFMANVGIGITDPKNRLDVNGIIHSKEVKIDLTGWSDFVFKKDYDLPTLEEVEKHITEKGHLENIPSEEEVLKNGINVGEMNAKLLQKIEEMTLYMIEQNKKINTQSKEIESLKSLVLRVNKIERDLRQK
ncbi:hypothetical protein [Flavobacterium sp. B183]|uniref:hypothetical protein n=1 Tax=Flavobacterium sp. B183 TaxID=907046 RepID=UPI00201F8EE8|nr:hypothetical protein [Flavobacterium sp. B183]URC11273.1 hypothetical protein M4I44_14330 [Flavobacterium sp. B183]